MGAAVDPHANLRAQAKYLPLKSADRRGLGLCLSGGGFRAALFHLGALRRLNELGLLSQIRTLSSVSGGSIVSAFVADRLQQWPQPGTPIVDWDTRIAEPLHRFTASNIRTWPVLRRLLFPWNWGARGAAVEALAAAYERHITQLKLRDLPAVPQFVLCATNMSYGTNWTFTRSSIGDQMLGTAEPPAEWSLARAVAASSCFPPVFNPMRVPRELCERLSGGDAQPGSERDECISDCRLTDGGVYDNLGVESVWRDHTIVFVSDGGATLNASGDKGRLRWRLSRYAAIQGNQSTDVRKRWLITSFLEGVMKGTYWGIGSSVGSYSKTRTDGYDEALVKQLLARVRTDMDSFTEAERCALENHGYLVCDAAIQEHIVPDPEIRGTLAPITPTPIRVPHPGWMDAERVKIALRDSSKRKYPLGRGMPR